MFDKLFCKHQYKTFRKSVKEVKEAVYPKPPNIGGSFHIMKNVSVEFNMITETTEVLICEKCGKLFTIHY